MATNVAAIGDLARNSHSRAFQLLAGLLDTLGRAVAETLVGALIIRGMLSASGISLRVALPVAGLLATPMPISTGPLEPAGAE